jgi:hypothetical protein
MRKAVLIPLLALATAAPASAAAQDSPYRIKPTRSCLIRHGANRSRGGTNAGAHRLTSAKEPFSKNKFGFDEHYDALEWNASGRLDRITGQPTDEIGIEFTPNPARGLASERRVRHILRAYFGYGAAWIRRHLMRRANVVIAAYTTNRPLTAGQKALLLACLRR